MAFLIVDPNPDSCQALASMVIWSDRRHRVDFAADARGALELTLKRRPKVAFIAENLPDMQGSALCNQLRARQPRLKCVALSKDEVVCEGFDYQIYLPATRLQVLSIIQESKSQSERLKIARENHVEIQRRTPLNAASGPSLQVIIGLSNDSMQFGVAVPKNSTVGAAIEQIGKKSVQSFKLIRAGKELVSNRETMLQENDRLLLEL